MNRTFLLTFLFLTHPVFAQSESELYEKVFGKKLQEQVIELPLLLGKKSLGEVPFYILGDEIVAVNTDILKSVIGNSVSQKFLETIKSGDRVKLSAINENLNLKLYRDSLYVSTTIAPRFYKQEQQLTRSGPDIRGRKVFFPKDYSHILNYWYNLEQGEGRSTWHNLDLDSNLHLKGYTLENEFRWDKDDETNKVSRIRSTLIKDFVSYQNRLKIGDIDYETTSFQTRQNLLGLSVSKDHELDPYRNIQPLNQFEFLLNQKSYVTVYVNDRPVRSSILDKGKHSIKDLVLDYGRNNIRIVTKELAGQTKEYNFSWSASNDLLRKGYHQYSHNIGVRSSLEDSRSYDGTKSLTYSGFHQQGLTNLITGGLSTQLNKDFLLFGSSLYSATDIGPIRFESSFSVDDITKKKGGAFEIELDLLSRSHSFFRYGVSFEYLSPYYTSFNTLATANKSLSKFRADVNWYATSNLSVSFDYSKALARYSYDEDKDIYGAGLSVSPFRGMRVSANYDARKEMDGVWAHRLSAYLNYAFGDGKTTLSANRNFDNDFSNAHLNYSPKKSQDAFYHSARVEDNSRVDRAILTSGYKSRYFNSQLSANVKNNASNTYEGMLRGAVITTKDYVGFAPPVYNSYAYLRGQKALEGKKIGLLNSTGGVGQKEYRTSLSLPNLSPYYYYRLNMDPTHLEHGNSYDHEEFFIYPSYKSVVGVDLGTNRSYVLFGNIVSKDASLKTGELISESGVVIPFFTNREGRFVIESVVEGKYQIWLNGKLRFAGVDVVQSDKTFIDLGNIK